MLKYIGKRIVSLIPVLLAITFLVFLLMYLTPGDPALMRLSSQGTTISEELLAQMRAEMGLDKPFLTRYLNWLTDLLRGDFGISYAKDIPIFPMMVEAVKYTVILAAASTIVSVVIGIPIGVFTAIKKDSLA